ncbi:MAG: DUF3179 domain-containing protein [Chloroflexi bacterium]|nr:DUF3179 domain-containing protein [Chloroflexota bacterium]
MYRIGKYLLVGVPLAALSVLAGCTSRPAVAPQPEAPPASAPAGEKAATPRQTAAPPAPSKPLWAIAGGWKTDFSKHSVPFDEISSGGVPRDGIPPIYQPKFETLAQADKWLTDKEPVVALELAGDKRAYPLRILTWHEVVDDEVGDIPVAVTYCPLCNTAVAFDRRVDGNVLTFGVSGLLRHSDLVMWDHQSESLWQQGTGEGIAGEHTGKLLSFFPVSIVSWQDFKAAHPDGKVLSKDTGHFRSYGVNPYSGYDTSARPFLFAGNPDPRLPALERVVGVGKGDTAVAYSFSALAKLGVVNDKAGSRRIVVFYQSGTVSALDRSRIPESRDVGAAAVFAPQVDGKEFSFESRDGKIFDRETGSHWNILGRAVTGPLTGKALEPVVHGTHFWFAWAAFNPQTRIFSPDGRP